MLITVNPSDLSTHIIDNASLLELLKTHKEYCISQRKNIFNFLSDREIKFLDKKVEQLNAKIEYLSSKIK